MNYLYLLIALITLLLTFIFIKTSSKNLSHLIFICLLGLLVTLFILMFPLVNSVGLLSKFVTTLIYTIQTITFNQDLELVNNITVTSFYEGVYIGIIYILFLLIPLMTTTYLLSLIDGVVSKIRLFLSRHTKIYIFSEINEKTLAIASKMHSKNVTTIFIKSKNQVIADERIDEVKAIKGIMFNEFANIKLKKYINREVAFYLFSSNTTQNLNQAIEITNKYKNNTNSFKVYVLTKNNVDSLILDSIDKGNIQLEVVDENERIVYQLLNNKPLYLEAINNKIAVLIISDDTIGLDFIKAITWCGQLISYKLSINILGENAMILKDYIQVNYPELLDNYDYNFIPYNLNSINAQKELDKIKDINYVIIANKDDKVNIEDSLFLRKYFINQDKLNYRRSPIINVMVKNALIATKVNELKNEKNNLYNLNTFGNIRNIYYENNIIDSKLEDLTKNVHLSYDTSNDPLSVKLKRFYEKAYYINSSRAMALHLNYKLYTILKEEYSSDEKKNIALFKEKIKDKEIFDKLVRNEHDRWMAFMRVNGYKSIDAKKVAIYRDYTNSHVHYLAKLHPCIVPFDDLERVGKTIKKEDVITSDGDIIKKMVDILSNTSN